MVSLSSVVLSSTGHSPEQLDVVSPALSRGLDCTNLQKSLLTNYPVILKDSVLGKEKRAASLVL